MYSVVEVMGFENDKPDEFILVEPGYYC